MGDEPISLEDEVPVLIAGGGMVGLSLATFLAEQGIPSLAVERLKTPSSLPRAGHFHLRTIEIFRAAGIEDEVIRQSEEEFLPDGAIVALESLAGKKLADIIPSLNEGVEPLSPCRRWFIGQPGLERILRARADMVGARVLRGHEIVGLEQDAGGVAATACDVETGEERQLRAKYLVGADGAHSRVRELLGIPMDGRGIFSNSMTIYFTADVFPLVGDKPYSVIYINNPVFGGFFRMEKHCQHGFLVINTVGDPKTNPDRANAAADTSEARLIELVRAGAGVPDLDVRIDGVTRWRATSDVAREFQDGRVFLVGDAAHLMPPNGGFGGNTGIHDAHNLAWKLAYVLNGLAGPALLDSYAAERRPIGKLTVEQAYSRYVTRTATYLEADDYQPVADDFNLEIGYLYHSPAVLPDGGTADADTFHADPRETRAMPGSRAPHLWLEREGDRISSLDLFDRAFVLLTGPAGEGWCAPARAAAAKRAGLPFAAHVVGIDLGDPGGQFAEAYGIASDGAVLVRPDGFVAWRSANMADDPGTAMSAALDGVLAAS